MRTKRVVDQDGQHYGHRFACPGCNEEHIITTAPYSKGPVWGFNGDAERPTFTPSVLVYEGKKADGTVFSPRCHSFVRDGRIEYLGDCTHPLAGQTIDLPELDAGPETPGRGEKGQGSR